MANAGLFPKLDSAAVLAGYVSWALCTALAFAPLFGYASTISFGSGICEMERWGRVYGFFVAIPAALIFAFALNVVRRIPRISPLWGKIAWGALSLALIVPAAVGLAAASSLMLVNCGGSAWASMTMSDTIAFYWSHAIASIVPQIEAVYGGQDQLVPNLAKAHAVVLRLFLSATVVWILAEIVTSVRKSYLQESNAANAP